jgi:ABC-type transport system involved in cytochrome bd biosynthesis, ATPase and permease components
MGKTAASESELWAVLEQVNLADFLRTEKGLDTLLSEKAGNLSSGQCQRLALARALLHDSYIYFFDEATSNIDVESENDIMREIHRFAKTKTVILISHRLVNVTVLDNIYVMKKGRIMENGNHRKLLSKGSVYAKLWNVQQSLENYGNEKNASFAGKSKNMEKIINRETEKNKEEI